jgi:two-component system LytT family sensor kinase
MRTAVRTWTLALLLWTGLALFFTTQIYLDHSYSPNPLSRGQAFVLALTQWYAWAAAAPLVLWLARRFPFERGRWMRALVAHFPAGLVLSFAKTALDVEVAQQVIRGSRNAVPVVQLHLNALTYAVIVGAGHAAAALRRARERELRASRAEAQLANAQLQALRMQLQPHFLFNTLHAISTLVHEDPDAADKMIARLSDLLRALLDHTGVEEVPLGEELEFVKRYVEIQQIRFTDRLSVAHDIAPETLDALVPSLILQPLVENAIRHGIAPRAGPGRVEIRSRREELRVRLEVRDDGPGLPAEYREGLGLANTRARLAHLYGSTHSLELLPAAPGGGLVVSITLPFRARRAS